MLEIHETNEVFTMLAIDPGLNNTGIAIYRIQRLPEVKILSINALTLKAERLIDDTELDDDEFTERLHKRYMMGSALTRLLMAHNPCMVVSESPFFDRRKPGSFAVLTEVLTTLFDAVVKYNSSIKFSIVEPQLVKKVLGVAGIKGKEIVREAMEKQDELINVLEQDIDYLDEHGIDAIGVGYTWLKVKSGLMKKE